jgi:DNA-directed RNA polymerase specialized sigma24 family protein
MQDHSAQLRLLRRLTIAGVGLREAIVLIACDGRKSSEIADATRQDRQCVRSRLIVLSKKGLVAYDAKLKIYQRTPIANKVIEA